MFTRMRLAWTWLGRLFANELAKNSAVYALGRVIAALVSLALLPVFTRRLSQADFGLIGILWLVMPLTYNIVSLGLAAPLSLKFFKLSHKEFCLYLYNALLTITVSSLAFSALGLYRIDWARAIVDPNITRTTFGLLMVSIVFQVYLTMMQDFMRLMGKPVYYVALTALPPVVITATTYMLVLYGDESYTSYVAGMAAGNGLFGLIALVFFFARYPVKHFYPSLAVQEELLRVGLPIIPGAVGGILLASADRYVIKAVWGLEAVAIYTYGYRWAEYIAMGLFQPFHNALFPIVWKKAAHDFKEAASYNLRVLLLMLSGFPLLVAAAMIPMKDIMSWLGNVAYDQSYMIFLIAILGVLLLTAAQVVTNLLLNLERTDLNALSVMLGGVLNIGLNIWLIPRYGIVAGAFTTIVSYLFMLLFIVMAVNRLTTEKIKLSSIFFRVAPFSFYLLGMFYVDEVMGMAVWQAYALKLGLFLGLVLVTWAVFPEVRGISERRLSRATAGRRPEGDGVSF